MRYAERKSSVTGYRIQAGREAVRGGDSAGHERINAVFFVFGGNSKHFT